MWPKKFGEPRAGLLPGGTLAPEEGVQGFDHHALDGGLIELGVVFDPLDQAAGDLDVELLGGIDAGIAGIFGFHGANFSPLQRIDFR